MLFALSSFAAELCVVTFNIKQSTFTLSISEHLKKRWPVSKSGTARCLVQKPTQSPRTSLVST